MSFILTLEAGSTNNPFRLTQLRQFLNSKNRMGLKKEITESLYEFSLLLHFTEKSKALNSHYDFINTVFNHVEIPDVAFLNFFLAKLTKLPEDDFLRTSLENALTDIATRIQQYVSPSENVRVNLQSTTRANTYYLTGLQKRIEKIETSTCCASKKSIVKFSLSYAFYLHNEKNFSEANRASHFSFVNLAFNAIHFSELLYLRSMMAIIEERCDTNSLLRVSLYPALNQCYQPLLKAEAQQWEKKAKCAFAILYLLMLCGIREIIPENADVFIGLMLALIIAQAQWLADLVIADEALFRVRQLEALSECATESVERGIITKFSFLKKKPEVPIAKAEDNSNAVQINFKLPSTKKKC